jgi:hypothetical protein
LGFLEKTWQMSLGSDAVGFKITTGQNAMVLATVLEDEGVCKIIVRRRSRLRTYISEKIAFATGQWEVYSNADLVPRPRVDLVLSELEAMVARNESFYREVEDVLTRRGQQWHTVWYETMLDADTHREILDFLSLEDDVALVPSSVKQNPTDIALLLNDAKAVRTGLAGTPFIEELEDALADRTERFGAVETPARGGRLDARV